MVDYLGSGFFANTFGNHWVGLDGTAYTYSRDDEVVRLDPETGIVLNTSIVVSGGNGFLTPTMEIGDDGLVYLAVEDWPFYKLYIFTPDLEFLWGEEINGLRGVALEDSVMAINGKNDIIRAYKGRFNTATGVQQNKLETNIPICPNPSNGIFNIRLNSLENNDAILDIINTSGKIVYSLKISSDLEAPFKIDISDQNDGIYILRYFSDDKYHFQKIIKQ